MTLHQEGLSDRVIARRLGIHRDTVSKFLRSDSCPHPAHRRYSSRTDPFPDYLWKRWKEGCRNAQQLTDEIEKLGFTASYSSVRRRVAWWRKASFNTTKPIAQQPAKPSTSRLS